MHFENDTSDPELKTETHSVMLLMSNALIVDNNAEKILAVCHEVYNYTLSNAIDL